MNAYLKLPRPLIWVSLGDRIAGPNPEYLGYSSHHCFIALGPEGDLWIATRIGLERLPGAVPGPTVPVSVPGVRGNSRFGSLLVADGRLWTTAWPSQPKR